MLSYLWCQTSSVSLRTRIIQPEFCRIRTDFHDREHQWMADIKSIETKMQAFKIIKNIHSIEF